MESRGVLVVVLLVVCVVNHSTQEALQDVMQPSQGLHHPIADAIEQLAAEGKQWLARLQAKEQLDQESVGKQNAENTEQDEGRTEQEKKGSEQQDSHRTGRMLQKEEEGQKKPEATGRIFLGGIDDNQQVTISIQGLLSGVFFAVIVILFFKVVAAIITGRDLSYWTNWADRFINPAQYPPSYYTDHSTYTAYRAFEDVPEKYDS